MMQNLKGDHEEGLGINSVAVSRCLSNFYPQKTGRHETIQFDNKCG